MKKYHNFLSFLLIIGLSLFLFAGCSSQLDEPANEAAGEGLGNFETITLNELAELEDSVNRIGKESETAKDEEAAKYANELNHIKMHVETLQENVNTGYDEHAVTEATKMDIDGRADELKSTIDDLVTSLKESAGSYASQISTDVSAPIENVKTKEGLQKVVDNYTTALDGIEADLKDGKASKKSAKEYVEDMKAHVAYVTQLMDGLESDKAITKDEKDTFTKDFDELNSRIDSIEKN